MKLYNFEKEKNELKERNANIKLNNLLEIFNNSSSIIQNKIDYQKLIIKWIQEKVNKNIIKINLIFKMSKNGSNSDDFHQYCDNQGPTLTITQTSKDKIFGGFTNLSWNNHEGYINDKSNNTFIFSLNLKKRYDMININKVAICCGKITGPHFGHDDFGFRKNMKVGFVYALNNTNFLSNNNLELIDEKGNYKTFEAKELEVYQILF